MMNDYPEMSDEARRIIFLVNTELEKINKRIADLEFTLNSYINTRNEFNYLNREMGFRL